MWRAVLAGGVPELKEDEEIREITLYVNALLNVMSLPGLTDCNKLKELRARRFGNALSDKHI